MFVHSTKHFISIVRSGKKKNIFLIKIILGWFSSTERADVENTLDESEDEKNKCSHRKRNIYVYCSEEKGEKTFPTKPAFIFNEIIWNLHHSAENAYYLNLFVHMKNPFFMFVHPPELLSLTHRWGIVSSRAQLPASISQCNRINNLSMCSATLLNSCLSSSRMRNIENVARKMIFSIFMQKKNERSFKEGNDERMKRNLKKPNKFIILVGFL